MQEDSRKIEQIITANPAYLLLLPDHMARTLDTPTVSFEELSLRNIFYRELKEVIYRSSEKIAAKAEPKK